MSVFLAVCLYSAVFADEHGGGIDKKLQSGKAYKVAENRYRTVFGVTFKKYSSRKVAGGTGTCRFVAVERSKALLCYKNYEQNADGGGNLVGFLFVTVAIGHYCQSYCRSGYAAKGVEDRLQKNLAVKNKAYGKA